MPFLEIKRSNEIKILLTTTQTKISCLLRLILSVMKPIIYNSHYYIHAYFVMEYKWSKKQNRISKLVKLINIDISEIFRYTDIILIKRCYSVLASNKHHLLIITFPHTL